MKKHLFPTVIIIALCMVLSSCGGDARIREMKLLMNTEKWEQAVEKGTQYLQANPTAKDKDDVRKNVAKCYLEWGKAEGGEKNFEGAVTQLAIVANDYKDTPSYAEALKELSRYRLEHGRKLLLAGKALDAAVQFRQLIEADPAAAQVADAKKHLQDIGMVSFCVGTDLWVMNADGSHPKKVASNAIDGDLVSTGEAVVFIRPDAPNQDKGKLFKVAIASGQETLLLDMPALEGPYCAPTGQDVIVTKNDGYQLVGLDGAKKELAKKHPAIETLAGWLPDGTKLFGYKKAAPPNATFALIDQAFKTPEAKGAADKSIRDAAVSRDGKTFIYSTEEGLFLIPSDSPTHTDIIWTEGAKLEVHAISYSPDSKFILFVGKGKNDTDYRLYTYSIKKELKPIAPVSDTPLIPNTNYRVSWSKGWLY